MLLCLSIPHSSIPCASRPSPDPSLAHIYPIASVFESTVLIRVANTYSSSNRKTAHSNCETVDFSRTYVWGSVASPRYVSTERKLGLVISMLLLKSTYLRPSPTYSSARSQLGSQTSIGKQDPSVSSLACLPANHIHVVTWYKCLQPSNKPNMASAE